MAKTVRVLTLASNVAADTLNEVIGSLDLDDIADADVVRVVARTTAVAGTAPSVTLQVQTSADGTNWVNEGTAFTAITAAPNTQTKDFVDYAGGHLRVVVSAISGTTPSATVSVEVIGKVR